MNIFNDFQITSEKLKMNKTKKSNWTENLRNYFTEYSTASSIHGIQYLGERGRFFIERVLWFSVLCLFSSVCIFLIIKSYNKWETSPVIVSFATTETPIWEIPFPAVTICPEVKTDPHVFNYTDIFIKKMLLKKNITVEENNLLLKLGLICPEIIKSLDYYYNETTNGTVSTDIVDDLMMLFDHTLPLRGFKTYWVGEIVPKSEYTKILTEEGVCISFNIINPNNIFRDSPPYFDNTSTPRKIEHWSLEHGYSSDADDNVIPKRTFLSGLKGGAMFYMFVNDTFLDYACGDGVQGFKVMIHHPFELPDFNKYIRVPLNEYVQVGIKPKMITVSDTLRSYSPHTRNCYFPEQRHLRYFYNYTQKHCMIECLANYTLSECKCLPFYMPKVTNIPICDLGSHRCTELCKVGFGKNELKNKTLTKCDCLPSCASLEYEIDISQTSWNWRKFFLMIQRIKGPIPALDVEKDHMSYLSIYYKELYFMTSERNQLYGYVDFFSNTGGLLGLFIGFSATSAIEILYFLTLRLICNLKKSGRKCMDSGDSKISNRDNESK